MIARQVFGELRYRKINKKKVFFIFFDLMICLLFHSWIESWMIIWWSLGYLQKKEMEKEMPEVSYFVPMELEARQKYVAAKGYLEGGLMGLYITVCLLLSQVPLYRDGFRLPVIFYSLWLGVDYLLLTGENSVISENVRYRRIEKNAFKKICCPGWYRVLDALATIVRVIVVITSFLWCARLNYDMSMNDTFISKGWVLALLISVVILLILHVFRMRYILFTVNMGDYNARSEEEE